MRLSKSKVTNQRFVAHKPKICEDKIGIADIHSHTCYSGFSQLFHFLKYPESVATPDKMVDKAIEKNIDVLCITDHNEIDGAIRGQKYAKTGKLDIDVVIGEEITTASGEILGIFLNERIPPKLKVEETIDLIHEQGGLAIVPHPFSYFCPSIGWRARGLPIDGVEVLNGAHIDPYVNKLAKKLFANYFSNVGGSDAHSPKMIGNAFTIFNGKTSDELYNAIIHKETKAEGRSSPLRHWIYWTMEIAYGVFERLIRPPNNKKISEDTDWFADPLSLIDNLSIFKKIIVGCGCVTFIGTPLPLLCGMIGDGWTLWNGHKKWREVTNKVTSL
ncbi:MAG: PHP domain-containing protein [Candidatus Methanoliparum thermophilum]|uniref:PHP domain-containing protein n=1 Tax=Methanoliparum thermophilum TaxID=2491083 RepID=A0A520KTA4_METT2|nr:PHP domain-containing protein [Candidatus Methanoliparum sp. LAM-1]RZN65205.1 MAG: PHP domain-containing protein [Candidatus Methanoliparum thermophilum]BDC36611.1 hypothetical protein MTLP_12930 [Candidatus Methanoliparum sp. LAM-1]